MQKENVYGSSPGVSEMNEYRDSAASRIQAVNNTVQSSTVSIKKTGVLSLIGQKRHYCDS